MGKNFLDLRNFLEGRFPDLIGNIDAELYPPPAGAQLAASITGWLQMFCLACLFLGKTIFASVGLKEDSAVVRFFDENKMVLFIGCLLLNNIASNMTNTGAFEVTLEDQLIFSKLEMGRFPRGKEIVDRLVAAGLQLRH